MLEIGHHGLHISSCKQVRGFPREVFDIYFAMLAVFLLCNCYKGPRSIRYLPVVDLQTEGHVHFSRLVTVCTDGY